MENKYIKKYTIMNKKLIRLTEQDLHRIVKESVNRILNEISDSTINEVSASLANRAASKALKIGREGFGKYGSYYDGIPFDSYHGKKYLQGNKFLKYFHEKLGFDEGYRIYYLNGTGDVMVLKDPNGNICTKPCHSIEELEMEYNKLQNEKYQ